MQQSPFESIPGVLVAVAGFAGGSSCEFSALRLFLNSEEERTVSRYTMGKGARSLDDAGRIILLGNIATKQAESTRRLVLDSGGPGIGFEEGVREIFQVKGRFAVKVPVIMSNADKTRQINIVTYMTINGKDVYSLGVTFEPHKLAHQAALADAVFLSLVLPE